MISDSSIKRSDEKTKPDSLIAQRPIGNKTGAKIRIILETTKNIMVFDDFKDVISEQRMNRYLFSVNNNTRNAQTLYTKNLKL